MEIQQTKLDSLKAENQMLKKLIKNFQTKKEERKLIGIPDFKQENIDVKVIKAFLEEYFSEIDGLRRKVRQLRQEIPIKFEEMRKEIIEDCK